MEIIAVDDEKIALEGLFHEIQKAVPDAGVHGFRSAQSAAEFLKEHSCDVAFLDIKMRGMNGIDFAKQLKLHNPRMNIIFTTGYDEYTKDALALHVSGYILKPVTSQKIAQEMEELRYPVAPDTKQAHGTLLKIQTFGNFEVYHNGEPLKFSRSKSKELFAYLVHKCGSSCSSKELIAVLFENRPYSVSLQKQFQTILSTMLKTLKEVGADSCIVRGRNSTALDPEKVDCDYYHFLDGKADALNSYHGEYMANYSWAEFVTGYLEQQHGN